MASIRIPLKVVTIGDGAVGKTCLLMRYALGEFPNEYIPTVFDNYSLDVLCEGTTVQVGLWDMGGGEDYGRLRPLSYPQTDIFLLCYSIISPNSFANVRNIWIPEVSQHAPNTPVLLIGTKSDLRGDEEMKEQLAAKGLSMITPEEAVDMGQEVGAVDVLECSAFMGDGVKEVFDKLVRIAVEDRLPRPPNSTPSCCLA
eukprot:TRINITY_DN16852_c0_g2_i1.p1 TRINITY_DN16852_c0_g2~~TRINITY_DN16852_c0_g2_i1.p1  ORF type:complete len:199 (+),score=40.01 TRINITY_DN16852_c0_g2_i1:151-747(+)